MRKIVSTKIEVGNKAELLESIMCDLSTFENYEDIKDFVSKYRVSDIDVKFEIKRVIK